MWKFFISSVLSVFRCGSSTQSTVVNNRYGVEFSKNRQRAVAQRDPTMVDIRADDSFIHCYCIGQCPLDAMLQKPIVF
jgi:hypothetical protein